jgi:hypothetical protein
MTRLGRASRVPNSHKIRQLAIDTIPCGIDEKGFETVIGRRSGSRGWKDVRSVGSVEESDGAIVITGINNNAFIVPSRAFASEQERLVFYEAARRFHAGSIP